MSMGRMTHAVTGATHAVTAATLLVALAACSDSSGPGGAPFDPARLMADGQALEQVLSHNVFQSVSVAAASADPRDAGALIVADKLFGIADARPGEQQRATMVLGRALLDLAPQSAPARILPSSVLGTTYVYDPATHRYAPAPGRTGAPTDGVRFILYAVNPITHEPVVTAEIGYADLIDEGDLFSSSADLRLVVVSNGVTYLEYSATIAATASSGVLAVGGYLSDGSTRVDFEINLTGEGGPVSQRVTLDFELQIRARNFLVRGHAESVESVESGVANIDLLVHSGGTRIIYDVTGSATTIDADIFINDRLFATISGNAQNPTVTGANGQALTEQEVQAFIYLIHLADAVFATVGGLLTAPLAFIGYLATIP